MKYYGKIGFWMDDVKTRPGVYNSKIVEKNYTGDILDNRQRWGSTEYQNDDLKITNRLSIISDTYLSTNISSVKYVTINGTKWKVKSIEIKYPRIIMDIGEVYNGVNV